ncbi:hypothetical protein KAR91_40185 [Candidatus Pacearchaeota archaeon]|nr:hypothetical protein [Candidatus Pacearchaeota archaeon]
MALEDLTTFDELIIRIVERKDFGRQSDTNIDEGTTPKLNDRFDTQREKVRDQTKIAEFKFPINFEGRTFYYQQYSSTNTYRQNTENGLTGIISEMYGRGLNDITMTGIFPTAAQVDVIAAANVSDFLSQYKPRDFADNLKRFFDLYADLHDPYSKIWTEKNYYVDSSLISAIVVGGAGRTLGGPGRKIGVGKTPNKAGYEMIVVDEYARTIQTIQPKTDGLTIFASKGTPFTFGWRVSATVIEDKLDANFKPIPDDILQFLASFRLPAISEIPFIGPFSQTFNKLIAINNSILRVMNTMESYINLPNTVVQDFNRYLASYQQIFNKADVIGQQIKDDLDTVSGA